LASLAEVYRAANIVDTPPQASREALQGIGAVLCSDLPRARQSAHALELGDKPVAESLFGEAQLPHFRQGRIRLPVEVWWIVLRLLWLAGFSRNGEAYCATQTACPLGRATLDRFRPGSWQCVVGGARRNESFDRPRIERQVVALPHAPGQGLLESRRLRVASNGAFDASPSAVGLSNEADLYFRRIHGSGFSLTALA